MDNKLLTIVIPVHNHWQYTKRCLGSIYFSDNIISKIDILVVDNASMDETEDFLNFQIASGYPIRVIKNLKNLDYLLAANQGWKEVKTPYCLHLNNDVVVEPRCIKNMLDAFEKDPKIGIVGGIQFSPTATFGKTLFHRGEDVDNHEDLRYVVPMTEEERNSPFVEVETTGFCCAMVKREVWEKIGHYDEQFAPAMSEQEDYCLRTREAGFKVAVVPKAFYIHYVGVSTVDNRSYYQEVLKINRGKFLNKWGEKLRKNLI